MNVSLCQAASALNANARWQEIVAENLASSSVSGFKRQEMSFEAVRSASNGPAATPGSMLTRARTSTSFQPGELRYTGVNTDVAIEGQGFFEVQMPNGTTAYTRNGEFRLNAQGELVTRQGYTVMGDSGPIIMDRSSAGSISIAPTGEVSQGTELRGRIKLMEFSDPKLLRQVKPGFFLADHPALVPTNVSQPSVRQGYLESSNASPVQEMANLMRLMRGFEATQRVVQAQDDRMGRAISELGNPS